MAMADKNPVIGAALASGGELSAFDAGARDLVCISTRLSDNLWDVKRSLRFAIAASFESSGGVKDFVVVLGVVVVVVVVVVVEGTAGVVVVVGGNMG